MVDRRIKEKSKYALLFGYLFNLELHHYRVVLCISKVRCFSSTHPGWERGDMETHLIRMMMFFLDGEFYASMPSSTYVQDREICIAFDCVQISLKLNIFVLPSGLRYC